jgi:hypothetical protein
VSKLTELGPLAALDHFQSLESADLKGILTHLKVELSGSSKKELQNLLETHLSEGLVQNLQAGRDAVEQAGAAEDQTHVDDLMDKLETLGATAAVQYFSRLDVSSLKHILSHLKVAVVAGSTKKQVQQLVCENLPGGLLQEAYQVLADAEATKLAAREQRDQQRQQAKAAQVAQQELVYAELLGQLESMEPVAANQHFSKVDMATLKKVLTHLQVTLVGKPSRKELQDLLRQNLPAYAKDRLHVPDVPVSLE